MKILRFCLVLLLLASMAYAMPLNSSARAVVPSDLLQLISVDYRALKDSPTAMALKQQLLPDNLKQFESALKGIGIDPDKDVDTLSFASFRTQKQGIKGIGVASGPFNCTGVGLAGGTGPPDALFWSELNWMEAYGGLPPELLTWR